LTVFLMNPPGFSPGSSFRTTFHELLVLSLGKTNAKDFSLEDITQVEAAIRAFCNFNGIALAGEIINGKVFK